MPLKRINSLYRSPKGLFVSAWFYLVIITGMISCYPFNSNTNQNDVTSANNSTIIVCIDSAKENFNGLFDPVTTLEFYKTHNFRPVWSIEKTKSLLADSLIQFIRSVRMYGLLPQDYHIHEIETFIDTLIVKPEEYRISRFDILLTDAFFSLTRHLKSGRFSPQTYERISPSLQPDSSQIFFLNTVLNNNGLKHTFESLEPDYDMYRKLRTSLREIVMAADSLEAQILFSGLIKDSSDVSAKVATIEINLERWRWEAQLKGRHIAVNIPAYRLEIVEADSVVLESKIIVGNVRNQTPVLDGLIRSFTIFPYWHVPRSISVKEILPRLKTDTLYLQEHHYEVRDAGGTVIDASAIDWTKYHQDNFPFMLRQREGTHNSLGLVKFSFNNPYSVYLHDTNARPLFNKEKRALSHGCVRVERALELGRYLVRDDNVYCSPEDLDQYLELKKQLTIKVVDPIPVHIRYFTCEYRNGNVEFYNDVYNLDKPLFDALYGQPQQEESLAL